MPNSLSFKEQAFVREYVKPDMYGKHNGTKAAIAAGYSPKTAHVAACRMLKKGKIQAEIAKVGAKLNSKLEISAEKVLQGLAELAFFDPAKMYNEDGSLKKMHEMDLETRRCIAGIEIEKLYKHFGKGQAEEAGQVTKVKHWDRGMNLERLGKHFKLFTEKVEHSVDASMAELIRSVRERKQAYERSRQQSTG